jgi:ubiquinone/menaquinone biosynthesis C-methylase UbiE
MMVDAQPSYDEIDEINLAAMARLAPEMPIRDKDLVVPENDLNLFFSFLPGMNMLDVGCGTGRYVHRFVDEGMQYLGIDYSEEMLVHARLNNLMLCKQFRVMNYHQLSFEDETFDALWVCCALNGEPKARLPETIKEFCRVLKPGGLLMIIQPVCDISAEELMEEHELIGRMYLSLWTFEEFLQALTDQGLQLDAAFQRPSSGSMTFAVRK